MFYTKYRPQKFAEISKPNDVALALQNQLKTNKTVHAYLFVGSRGTGKTTTARILSKALNCKDLNKEGDACGKCPNCLAISTGSFMDLIEIDAASNRGIDDIRDLKDKVKLSPALGAKKVYIIDEVHMLTTEAFNALLKTLEEPPKHAVFILCTTELHKVPETVRSRCQVFKFKRATIAQLTEKLKAIAEKEKLKVDAETLKMVASASYGGFRDAETLFQQVVEGNLDPRSLVNTNARGSYSTFLESLLEKNSASAIKLINALYDDGIDLSVWSGEFTRFLRDILFVKSGVESLEDSDEVIEIVKKLSTQINFGTLVDYLKKFSEVQYQVKSSSIPQLPLEILVVQICGEGAQDFPIVPSPTIKKPSVTLTPKPIEDTRAPAPEPKPVAPAPEVVKPVQVAAKPKKVETIPLESVKEKWDDVVKNVAKINSSIQSLLKQAKLVGVGDDGLQLEVSFAFHKERLESPKNLMIVEKVLEEVFGIPQTIKCIINTKSRTKKPEDPKETGVLTDYNVTPIPTSGNIMEMFDGGLPLVQ